jgi:Sporulation and spore germination
VIPRYQTVLFFLLLAASIVMGSLLWHLRVQAHDRLLAAQNSTPTQAPLVAAPEQATLYIANDAENSLQAEILSLPLPDSPNARARAVLGKLLDIYAAPDAPHPVPGGAASIAQVFLLPAIAENIAAPIPNAPNPPAPNPPAPHLSEKDPQSGPELAVVNLTGPFAATHPSGLETETLTLLSICATLRANLPRVTQVRFLVDGQPRPTLAGHADLTRTYLTSDAIPTTGSNP